MKRGSRLVELVERACQEEQALFAKLSEEERSIRGEPDRWSPKDAVAHIAAWKMRLAANLRAAACGEPLERYDDYEAVNARDFEENRDRPWSEILDWAAEACRRLIEQIEGRSEAELAGTETLPWQGERPLWRLIVGTGFMHSVMMHLNPVYLEREDKDYATRLQEDMAELLGDLDEGRDWQGLVSYNLACHYALVGEAETAIGKLREALELSPGIREWSQEDPDLTSIREEPGYLALYA